MTATDLAATLPADGQPVPKTGRLDWNIFLAWLVGRAKAGVPVDTVLGNYDMYLEWLRMFAKPTADRSEEHTSELQALMRTSYAVFCLKKKKYISHCQSQN